MKSLPVLGHDPEPFTLTPGQRLVSQCHDAAIGYYDVPLVVVRPYRKGKGTTCKLPDGTIVLYPPEAVFWVAPARGWARALWNMPRIRAALGGQSCAV